MGTGVLLDWPKPDDVTRQGPSYRYDKAGLVHVVAQSILATVITKLIFGILIFLTHACILKEHFWNIYQWNMTWKSLIFFKHSETLISKCWLKNWIYHKWHEKINQVSSKRLKVYVHQGISATSIKHVVVRNHKKRCWMDMKALTWFKNIYLIFKTRKRNNKMLFCDS